jgi:hypothetical protein
MLVYVGRTPSGVPFGAAGPLAGPLIFRPSSGTRASRADQGVRPTNQCTTPRLGKVSGIGRRHRILQVPLKCEELNWKGIDEHFDMKARPATGTNRSRRKRVSLLLDWFLYLSMRRG